MLTFVVMPCLDETALVTNTIASLGFMDDATEALEAHLIAVDNGSTDGTLSILNGLRRGRPRIHVAREAIWGFVPPRRRGVVEAERLARSLGVPPEKTLILQADADTVYREGYVARMQEAAGGSTGAMLEGSTKPPPDFVAAHPAYLAAQRLVDNDTDPLNAQDEDEVVLDDKVCGYRLADYLTWGGLFEESTAGGDEIHAETTRMFIRARLRHGARKIRVNPAGAIPSRRKVLSNPRLQYASVGFPREQSWIEAFASGIDQDTDAFAASILDGLDPKAMRLRRAHQLALFRYLPALVAAAEGSIPNDQHPPDVASIITAMPSFLVKDLADHPGAALMALFKLIDTAPHLFTN